MSQVLGGQVLIMVRLGESFLGEGWYIKVSISLEPSVQFTSFLDTIYLRVCPTTRWHHFYGDNVTGYVHRCAKCIGGTFSGRNQGKIQPGVIPECFPGCPVSSIIVVTVIQWYFLLLSCEETVFKENKSSLRSRSSLRDRSSLHQSVATMIYYEDCMTLPG